MPNWIIEGKYSDAHGWEELEFVTEEDGGEAEAARLLGEYRIAAPYAPHRMLPTDRAE